MIKREELSNPESCMSRAHDDEMTFVLLARDSAAPIAIRAWVAERVRIGKNKIDDLQISKALECAKRMEDQRALAGDSLKESQLVTHPRYPDPTWDIPQAAVKVSQKVTEKRRERFEKLANKRAYGRNADSGPGDLRRNGDGYVNPFVQIRWRGFIEGWQAGERSIAERAAQLEEAIKKAILHFERAEKCEGMPAKMICWKNVWQILERALSSTPEVRKEGE